MQKTLIQPVGMSTLYMAGGPFWELESYFADAFGVVDTEVGYANGIKGALLRDGVDEGDFAEVLRLLYDPSRVTLEQVLAWYVHFIALWDDARTTGADARTAGADARIVDAEASASGVAVLDLAARRYRYAVYATTQADLERVKSYMAALPPIQTPTQTHAFACEMLRNYTAASSENQDYYAVHADRSPRVALAERPCAPQGPALRTMTPEQMKAELPRERYRVLCENRTEFPFENEYWDLHEEGLYVDVVSGAPLFLSNDKYDSHSGWPSFVRPVSKQALNFVEDLSLGTRRIEVRATHSDTHLGHVFPDGPKETGGLRYCINSAALLFIPKAELAAKGYGAFESLIAPQHELEDPMYAKAQEACCKSAPAGGSGGAGQLASRTGSAKGANAPAKASNSPQGGCCGGRGACGSR